MTCERRSIYLPADRLDLEEVRRTGAKARTALEGLQSRYPELIQQVRGMGVMLAFTVARSDWRDVLRDRAFRRGLILLPAGDRALRLYPRYDTPQEVIDEAVGILEAAVQDILMQGAAVPFGPLLRMGPVTVPIARAEVVDLTPKNFAAHRAGVMAVEIERYGTLSQYPGDALVDGRRPMLQFPVEAIEASVGNARSVGLALRFSGRVVAYALGSPLENYDEEGVSDDLGFGEQSTFYLHAMAVHPSVRNAREVGDFLLEGLRARVIAQGYLRLSSLIEERAWHDGPDWLRAGIASHVVDNYLRSGQRFVYVQVTLVTAAPS